MKKILSRISIVLITLIIFTSNTLAEKIDCTKYKKVSANFLECTANNIKKKSIELKLKTTVGAEVVKEKIITNTKYTKKKFNKSKLKKKILKFKNSKTLTEFMEK